MSTRPIIAILAVSALLLQNGCLGTAKDKTVNTVTAPSRWFRSSQERRELEKKSKLSTREKAMEGKESATPVAFESSDFQEAVTLVQQRKFRPALDILDRLLSEQPNNDQLFQWKGDCHYNLLELEKAVAAYATARELNSNNHLALRGMGFAQLYLGHQYAKRNDSARALEHYNESITITRRVLQIWPADSEVQFARAMAIENATRYMADRARSLKSVRDTQGAERVCKETLLLCNEGIESAKFRITKHLEQPEPRVIVGNLFLTRARLLAEFGHYPNAVEDIDKARRTYTSILREIAPDHEFASRQVELCTELESQWKALVPR